MKTFIAIVGLIFLSNPSLMASTQTMGGYDMPVSCSGADVDDSVNVIDLQKDSDNIMMDTVMNDVYVFEEGFTAAGNMQSVSGYVSNVNLIGGGSVTWVLEVVKKDDSSKGQLRVTYSTLMNSETSIFEVTCKY